MKVYGDRGSSNTRRVLTTAAYLGLDIEFVFLDLFSGQNRTPQYLALNPNGTIPTLVDGDVVLFEASAIMIYLAEQAGSSLLPAGKAKYETLKWMFWAAEHFRRGPTVLIEQRFMERLKGHAENPTLVAEALQAIHRYTAVLNEHLSTRQFMVGDALTLADIDLAAPLSHIPRTQAPFLEYPHVAAWYARVNRIAAWQQSGVAQERRIVDIERLFSPPPEPV